MVGKHVADDECRHEVRSVLDDLLEQRGDQSVDSLAPHVLLHVFMNFLWLNTTFSKMSTLAKEENSTYIAMTHNFMILCWTKLVLLSVKDSMENSWNWMAMKRFQWRRDETSRYNLRKLVFHATAELSSLLS